MADTKIIDTRESILADWVRLLNPSNKTVINDIQTVSGVVYNGVAYYGKDAETIVSTIPAGSYSILSDNISFKDNFTKETFKFDNKNERIDSVTFKDLWDVPTGYNVNENGVISFTDTLEDTTLKDIVNNIDVVSLIDKLNNFGNIYDFQFKQLTFGDYKYANVKLCTDIANSFGYLSLDKFLNDERIRQLKQNELSTLYAGTDKESYYPGYSGLLQDQTYQVNGWMNIDSIIQLILGDGLAYDAEASFALRTKPFNSSKRIFLLSILNYFSDIYSLNSTNKLSEFGVRIVDRATGQELDMNQVQNNLIEGVGSNILSSYSGKLIYKLSQQIQNQLTPIPQTGNNVDYNKCDKVYINKCDGSLFTLKNDPGTQESGSDCKVHELALEVRINPYADTRINKPDIQNTIDPIHWTRGITGVDSFKALVSEFGEKSYTVSNLNEDRAFALGAGSFDDGIIMGGFGHDSTTGTIIRDTYETWNGSSWTYGGYASGRALGLLGGNSKAAVITLGVKDLILDPTHDDNGNNYFASSASIKAETNTEFFDGKNWFLAAPYNIPTPNIPRHSIAGFLKIDIIKTDDSKNTIPESPGSSTKEVLGVTGISCDDTYATVKVFQTSTPNQPVEWYKLTQFSGIVFGGSISTNMNLNSISDLDIEDTFEFVSWNTTLKYSITDPTSGVVTTSVTAGCWFVDSDKKYPVKAYGMSYVGNETSGLSTGGKTGMCGKNYKGNVESAYSGSSKFSEFDNVTLNLAYEYNGTTWVRRDNLPEEVYYHAGVGDSAYALYFGGMHGTLENAKIYDSIEQFESWDTLTERFGGVSYRNGTYGINGEIRYTTFVTNTEDANGNRYYQLGDIKDQLTYKSIYGVSDGLRVLPTGYIYDDFALNPSSVNDIVSNKHIITTTTVSGDTLNIITLLDGQSWKSKKIAHGNSTSKALLEETVSTGLTTINNLVNLDTPDISGNRTFIYIPSGSFAPRNNYYSALLQSYSGHTVKGGMWLWSRPSIGENLFHPNNFITSQDVLSPTYTSNWVNRGFNVLNNSISANSYFVNRDMTTNTISADGDGLVQIVYADSLKNNAFGLVEKWKQPQNLYNRMISSETTDVHNGEKLKLIIENRQTSTLEAVSADVFPVTGSICYGEFDLGFDLLSKNGGATTSQLNKFMAMQHSVVAALSGERIDVFSYDISPLTTWTSNVTAGLESRHFAPLQYDDFPSYFAYTGVTTTGFYFTNDNFSLNPRFQTSTIRDKSVLFPWCDLLEGNAGKKAIEGQITWNWIREKEDVNGISEIQTFLIVAETTYAKYDYHYTDTVGNTIIPTEKNWREIFKISKYNKIGEQIWTYTITYDENVDKNFGGITSTTGGDGNLFGCGIIQRSFNDQFNSFISSAQTPVFQSYNSKVIYPSNNDGSFDQKYDINMVDWKAIKTNVPVEIYQYPRQNLLDTIRNYNSTPNRGSCYRSNDAYPVWLWSVPEIPNNEYNPITHMTDSELSIYIGTVDGIIKQSGTSVSPTNVYTETNYIVDEFGNNIVDEFGNNIIEYRVVSDSTIPYVKQITSSASYGDGKYKVSKSLIAVPSSRGYMIDDYGKSKVINMPEYNKSVYHDITYSTSLSSAKDMFPWNVLLNNPNEYVDMIDGNGGFWFAAGNIDNKQITSSSDTHKNTYKIGYVNDISKILNTVNSKTCFTRALSSGNTLNEYRFKDAVEELLSSTRGSDIFDIYVTLTDGNYTTDQQVITTSTNSGLIAMTSSIFDSETIISSGSGFSIPFNTLLISGGVQKASDFTIIEQVPQCMSCYNISGGGSNVTQYESWNQHNHEEWSVPFIETPLAGVFSNEDFNVWMSSGEKTRWGTVVWNDLQANGEMWISFKSQKVGVDPVNQNVYFSIITSSITIENFEKMSYSQVANNIPCRVVYDEFIYPLSGGYMSLPVITTMINEISGNKVDICGKTYTINNKEGSVMCIEPTIMYLPEASTTTCTSASSGSSYYYTEWASNFVQEYKGRTNAAGDDVTAKYFFKYDTGTSYGSNTVVGSSNVDSFKIIETDWRRYQDGVGLGGDIPDVKGSACVSLDEWYLGQTAFGTPDKAVVVGGYVFKQDGDPNRNINDGYSWWDRYTTNQTFKWNKTVIMPEDTFNKNYRNRNFSPFFSNGENVFSQSMLGYVMFDVGKNIVIEKNGVAEFYNKNTVVVVFDETISNLLPSKDKYSIILTPSDNVKVWWSDKSETGFTINCELAAWTGNVDWSITYIDNIDGADVDSLSNQETYDKFKNI